MTSIRQTSIEIKQLWTEQERIETQNYVCNMRLTYVIFYPSYQCIFSMNL